MTFEEILLKRPTMIKILICLKERPRTLSSLSRELGVSKPRLKVYLNELISMGYVDVEGSGTRIYKLRRFPKLFQ